MSQPVSEAADALVLFGISGDLARKKLFAALYDLAADDVLPPRVVGVAVSDWDDVALRKAAADAIRQQRTPDDRVVEDLLARLTYVEGDYRAHETFDSLRTALGDAERPLSYLAIPPGLFEDVVRGLSAAGCSDGGRVMLEKPFGRDLPSARELNRTLREHYPEDAVYRIDHFLGKEPVQNLMVYRFANTFLEPIWNRHYVHCVRVTMAEDFGVEGRGSFYDAVGTLRDVVQNHLLQVVALLAMEPPISERPDDLRDERVKVLRAMRSIDPSEIVRGQYRGFLGEPGVADGSDTETYLEARLAIDSWRWAGVPWYVRAGKALATTTTEAVIELRRSPRPLFADPECRPAPNQLRFDIKPDHRITMLTQAKRPGERLVSRPVPLSVEHGEAPDEGPDAYARLLGDALRGDPSLFARQDGVEEAWRIVQPVLDAPPPVEVYERGSWGPRSAGSVLLDGEVWDDGAAE